MHPKYVEAAFLHRDFGELFLPRVYARLTTGCVKGDLNHGL